MSERLGFPSRLPALLGIRLPIVQGGMSWASSSAALALAVSRAGALGTIAAGPMRPEALVAAIREVRAGTDAPFAVNVPLYNKRAAEFLDIVEAERVPILIASQGGPKALPRFRAIGTRWIHVVASPAHAAKAEAAGVDAIIAVGGEAGGHPAPDEVSAMVLVRAITRAVQLPVIGAGGVADGAGIAAMFALGAEGAQLGTRFLMTEEASVHPAYKARVLAAGISDTTLVGRGRLPIRQLRNRFTAEVDAAERSGLAEAELQALQASRSLREAALEGDVEHGKVEAGQTAGLIDDILPAGELVRRLAAEAEAVRLRLAGIAQAAAA
jgi:enoyl-[acyl-carrier protein] reductase II